MTAMASGTRSVVSTLVMGLTAACAHAQVPVDHRPSADTIVAGILDQGALDLWARHADFQGCPQSDALGADLLTGLEPSGLTDWTLGDLAALWADELATCGHQPLEDWYRAVLSEVDDAISWSSVLTALPSPLPQALRDELVTVATSPGTPEGTRAGALARLSSDLSGTARIDFFLMQANAGMTPEDWVFYEIQFLFANMGSTYVSEVVQAVPTLSATAAHYASDPILQAVHAGDLSAGDPGVISLIAALEERNDLDYLYDMFIAVQTSFVLEAIQDLQAQVQALVDQGHLGAEHQTGLSSVLSQAQTAVVNDRPSAAPLMNAFISEVKGLIQGEHLDDLNGTQLIQDAEDVVTVLDAA